MYAVVLTYRQITTETNQLVSCRRRATDTIDRRFCFDVTLGTSDKNSTLTLQALSDDDMQAWLQAMDGKEPVTQPTCRRLLYLFSSRCSVWILHFVSFWLLARTSSRIRWRLSLFCHLVYYLTQATQMVCL